MPETPTKQKLVNTNAPKIIEVITTDHGRLAVSHKEIMKHFEEGKGFAPEDSAKLSLVKAKIEIVADYADMEKVRDLLKQLSKK